MKGEFKIITFYEFKEMALLGELVGLRSSIRELMRRSGVVGTIIIAEEGYNGTVAGAVGVMAGFIAKLETMLDTKLNYKASFSSSLPFRKIDVKIKPEIVTLKRPVNISLARGTHVSAERWNELISADDVVVLDTRNDYEFRTGTFARAINPNTEKFSDLPGFIERNLDPAKHKKIAMFCTGGIRCEKFAPYMKERGFEEVFQLEGGILKYLEVVPREKQLWNGECFVFDGRVTVDDQLSVGDSPDLSQNKTGIEVE